MFKNDYFYKKRIKNFCWFLIATLTTLGFRTFYVQNKFSVIATSEYNNSIEKEHISDYNYLLLDRNGKDLNTYKRNYRVIIDCRTFGMNTMNQNLDNFITFNYIMKEEVPSFDIDEIIKKESRESYLISKEVYQKIITLKGVKGIYAYEYDEKDKPNDWSIESILTKEKARNAIKDIDNYPKNSNSLEGQIIECTTDNKTTNVVFEKDIDGIYKQTHYEVDEDNNNVVLTLNKDYQEIVREVLSREEYDEFSNIGVAIIKSRTGEVVSLAQKNEEEANIITGGGFIKGFEPGSIFKITTLAAAMQYDDIKLSDTFECRGAICKDELIHGKINVQKAMEVSCNDVFADLCKIVGADKLQDFAQEQGYFTSVLNLDKDTGMESTGVRGDVLLNKDIIGIGQGNQVTPIQAVASLSTIVNNGIYKNPIILKKIETVEGKLINEFESKSTSLIDNEVADVIKNLLIDCVNNGTGKLAKVDGVEIGGKTGSAEGGEGITRGWFLGYFNLDGEYYSMVVFIPNIEGINEEGIQYGGGNTAAPIFSDIVSEIVKK